MVNDPMRFSKLSFAARAMAIPPIPKPVIRVSTFTSKTKPSRVKTPIKITMVLKSSFRKGTSWSSALSSVNDAL
ncbi:hypothetical protein D3C73_1511860 [compost metagenome]